MPYLLLELHLRRSLGPFLGLERLFPGQMEQERIGHAVRKGPDARVEILDNLIVADAGDIDPVFRPLQLVLQVKEILVGLEVRILFYYDHEAGEGSGQLSLALLELGKGLRVIDQLLACLHRTDFGPGFCDCLQGLGFMLRVPLYHLNKVGYQVSPPLVGGFDITPGGKNRFLGRLHAVVAAAAEQAKAHEREYQNYKSLHTSSLKSVFK